jgi:class 3 adenylate cyclase
VATCPACGEELPGEFPFCPFCTAPLAEQPSPSTLEERKVVSVLFCDLVGFTAASELQDPEDVRARIRPYHARLREEIERYGGTVEKFVGDAVMAVFGAPVAHEDDAERAVRAGLRILDAIAELNTDDPTLSLQVRIGINTGEAVVALGARPEQGEGIVTGDVVNTASRLQGVAPLNGLACSEQTYRQTKRVFEYERLASTSVKGKAQPLSLWRPVAARARFGSDIRRYSTAFVGRELEKALLISVFERAAQQRSCQLVTVVGEPGVGKSRLVGELFAYIDAKPELTYWRQGRCLPYGDGISFWALGEIVKAEAGILESDSAEVALGKLDAAVSPDLPERQWLLQRLMPLIGVEAAEPAERQELFTAWRSFLEGLAMSRPAVLVFDDLHWADAALLDFLEYLAEWSQGVPLLVLCTGRPELYERRPAWAAGQRNAHTINLPPLSNRETLALVAQLLTIAGVSHELEQPVVEQSEGNPLFAEECVRLLGDGYLEQGSDQLQKAILPDSVQALIAARLDTLSSERKGLLQDAAVLGKVFWPGAVAEISGRDHVEVELALHELGRKELVRPLRTSSMAGETEYSFWHLLVRDVAYAQIPRADRARRHRAAAAWIERKAGERVEDLAEVLAHHYLQALELAQAAGASEQAREVEAPARRFLALSGERALGLDTTQAEARLAQALELTPEDDAFRPHLLVSWADAALQAGRPREAAVALEQALASLRARGEVEAAAWALQLRSRIALRLGEEQAVSLAAEAVSLLEQETHGGALVDAHTQLAHALSLSGASVEAIAAADRACALAEMLALEEPARAVAYRGYTRTFLGDAQGVEEMERALALLLEQGAGREIAALQNNLAIARYPLEGPAPSLAAFEQGIAFSRQRGLREAEAALEANCPGLLAELGHVDEARKRGARLAPAAEATGDTRSLIEVRAVEFASRIACGEFADPAEASWLVETARATGAAEFIVIALVPAAALFGTEAPERARSLLIEIERTAATSETPYYSRQLPLIVCIALAADDPALAGRLVDRLEPRYPLDDHALCAARAQLTEHAGDHADAATLYAEAAARWQQFGNVPERAHALLGQGRCLLALGDPAAEQPLSQAAELFGSMGYRPALAETEALLEQITPLGLDAPR